MRLVVRKRLLETSRNLRFWLLTTVMTLLFAALCGVVFLAFARGPAPVPGRLVLRDTQLLTLAASSDALLRVPLVGAADVAWLPPQAPGYPQLLRFASMDEVSAWLPDHSHSDGFPFPFVMGLEGESTVLLANLGKGGPLDVNYLRMSLALAQARARANGTTFPDVSYSSYPRPADSEFDVGQLVFALVGPVLYGFGLVFLIPGFLNHVVADRAAKAFFLRCGMTRTAYWAGTWAVDAAASALLALLGFALVMAMGVTPLVQAWPVFLLSVVLYSLSACLVGYCVAAFFTVEETAQRWAPALLSLIYFVLSVPQLVTQALGASAVVQTVATVVPAALYPPLALSRMLSLLATFTVSNQLRGWTYAELFSSSAAVPVVLSCQVLHPFLYAGVLALLESRRRGRPRRRLEYQPVAARDDLEDLAGDATRVVVHDVSVSYVERRCRCCILSDKKALRGVSLSAGPGVFALLGQNGAGKTSLFRVLAGDEVPAPGGFASIMGCEPGSAEAFRRAAFLEQHDPKLDFLTVREFLELVCAFRGVPGGTAVIDALLADFELRGKGGSRLAQLSGGERRKVSVAASCLHNPRVLVLDEPTTGIDVSSARAVHAQLQALVARGAVIFINSHSMDEVMALADHVAMLVAGRVVACDTLRGLLAQYGRGVVVQAHCADTEALLVRLGEVLGGTGTFSVEHRVGKNVRVVCDPAVTPRHVVFRAMTGLKREGVVELFTVSDATLGSAFLNLCEEAATN